MATTTAPKASDYGLKRGRACSTLSIELAKHVLELKAIKPFRLYLTIKTVCSGSISIKSNELDFLSKTLGCSHRTIKNQLARLLELKWMGRNKKTGTYFVRGYGRLRKQAGIGSRTAYRIDLKNLTDLQTTLGALSIAHIAETLQKKNLKQHGLRQVQPPPKGTSIRFIAESIHIKKSTAGRLKKKALAKGLIFAEKRFTDANIYWADLPEYLLKNPRQKPFLRTYNGKTYRVAPDVITHTFKFTSRA